MPIVDKNLCLILCGRMSRGGTIMPQRLKKMTLGAFTFNYIQNYHFWSYYDSCLIWVYLILYWVGQRVHIIYSLFNKARNFFDCKHQWWKFYTYYSACFPWSPVSLLYNWLNPRVWNLRNPIKWSDSPWHECSIDNSDCFHNSLDNVHFWGFQFGLPVFHHILL